MTPPRDRDAMDTTHPPGADWRCSAHEEFTLRVENRLTSLETEIKAMALALASGFLQVNGRLDTLATQRTSDTRQLASRVGSVEAWKIGAVAVFGFLMFAVPVILTVIGMIYNGN